MLLSFHAVKLLGPRCQSNKNVKNQLYVDIIWWISFYNNKNEISQCFECVNQRSRHNVWGNKTTPDAFCYFSEYRTDRFRPIWSHFYAVITFWESASFPWNFMAYDNIIFNTVLWIFMACFLGQFLRDLWHFDGILWHTIIQSFMVFL